MQKISLFVITACLLCSAWCQNFPSCDGQRNELPLVDMEPQFLQSVAHGEKYLIQNETNFVYILNLFGSPYEMGYAAGQLMGEAIKENSVNLLAYVAPKWSEYLQAQNLPFFVIKLIQKTNQLTLLQACLEWNYIVSRPYTNPRWIQEMQGIADASGMSLRDLIHVNLFPEISRAACTIVGAWDQATEGNVVRQLRALDWSPDAPVNQYPLITVYHSTEEGSITFANIGFAGLIGSFTAFSSKGIALGEKVWMTRPEQPYTFYGYPWTYVFRDIAQFSSNLSDAVKYIFDAKRTVSIHLGIGSLPDESFLGFQYSEKTVDVFNDKNYTYTAAHPQMDGVLFWDKHLQPSQNPCLGSILESGYGNIDTEFLFRSVTGINKTGDGQICVFDFVNQEVWLAYSYGTTEVAYERNPIRIQFRPFFESTEPSQYGIFSK